MGVQRRNAYPEASIDNGALSTALKLFPYWGKTYSPTTLFCWYEFLLLYLNFFCREDKYYLAFFRKEYFLRHYIFFHIN